MNTTNNNTNNNTNGNSPSVEIPTVAWVIENRKNKDGKKKNGKKATLSGHNIFIMVWAKKFKVFPGKGVWEGYSKQAWKALAVEYNATL
jgi:hypothetical protein